MIGILKLAEDGKKLLSIGGVAKVTGISVFKLRMWERRYGAPNAIKLPSGHRRYSADEVERIKLVKLALDNGHKISKVAPLSAEDLTNLLGDNFHASSPHKKVSDIVEKSGDWDEGALFNLFENDWKSLGPIGFITSRAANLLESVGSLWEVGSLSIAQEHFISGALEKFLEQKWTEKNMENSSDNYFLLSSFEGESHQFGLQFCAVAATTAGSKVFNLFSMPEEEIANTAIQHGCVATCISISNYYNQEEAIRRLKRLRKLLPDDMDLIIGGNGAPLEMEGILMLPNLESLYDWAVIKEQDARSRLKG